MQKRFSSFFLFVVLLLPMQSFAGPVSKSTSSGYRKHVLTGGAIAAGGVGVALLLAYNQLKKARIDLAENTSEERKNAYKLAKKRVNTLLKAGGASVLMTALLAFLAGGSEDVPTAVGERADDTAVVENPVHESMGANESVGQESASAVELLEVMAKPEFPSILLQPAPQVEPAREEQRQESEPLDAQVTAETGLAVTDGSEDVPTAVGERADDTAVVENPVHELMRANESVGQESASAVELLEVMAKPEFQSILPQSAPQVESGRVKELQEIKPLAPSLEARIRQFIVGFDSNFTYAQNLLDKAVAGFEARAKAHYGSLFLSDAVQWGDEGLVRYLHTELGVDIKAGGKELLKKAVDPAVYIYLAENGLREYVDPAAPQMAQLFLKAMHKGDLVLARGLCDLGFDPKNADQEALFEKFLLLLPDWTPALFMDKNNSLNGFFDMCLLHLNTPAKQLECCKVLYRKTGLWNCDYIAAGATRNLLATFALDFRLDFDAVDGGGRNMLMCALADESKERQCAQEVCDIILSDEEKSLFQGLPESYGRSDSALARINVNRQDNAGFSALMLAVKNGKIEYVRSLLARGANPNSQAKNGDTALSLAVQKKDKELVNILRAAGALDTLVKSDKTLEIIADSRSGSIEAPVEVPSNAQSTASVLQEELQEIRSLSADDQASIRSFIQRRASMNLETALAHLTRGYNERTKKEALCEYSNLFLADAVNSGDVYTVEFFHLHGANIAAGGQKLLDEAKKPLVYAYLAVHGLGKHVNLKSPEVSEAFVAAVSNRHFALASGLRELGFCCAPSDKGRLGKKFLELLSSWSLDDSYLEHFAEVSQLDLNQAPLLQLACLKKIIGLRDLRGFSSVDQAVRLFVEKFKLNLKVVDKQGYNTLMCALCSPERDWAKKLSNYLLALGEVGGLDINHQGNDGKTALMLAIINDEVDIVDSLLKRGADLDSTDRAGKGALAYALAKENKYFAALLFKRGKLNVPEDLKGAVIDLFKSLLSSRRFDLCSYIEKNSGLINEKMLGSELWAQYKSGLESVQQEPIGWPF